MKYFVAVLVENDHYLLKEFDNLTHAYRFYLEEPNKRMILRGVNPEVVEK